MPPKWLSGCVVASSTVTEAPLVTEILERYSACVLARVSGVKRLAKAAYLIACKSIVSGAWPRLSSATTRRPSPSKPNRSSRSASGCCRVCHLPNSKVTMRTLSPKISGFARTHSWRSARYFCPASARLTGFARWATPGSTEEINWLDNWKFHVALFRYQRIHRQLFELCWRPCGDSSVSWASRPMPTSRPRKRQPRRRVCGAKSP